MEPKIRYWCMACPLTFTDAEASNAHHDATGHNQTFRKQMAFGNVELRRAGLLPAPIPAVSSGATDTLHAAASDLHFIANGGECEPETLHAHADALLAAARSRPVGELSAEEFINLAESVEKYSRCEGDDLDRVGDRLRAWASRSAPSSETPQQRFARPFEDRVREVSERPEAPSEWQRKDREWSECPIGTKARDHTGCDWTKIAKGMWRAGTTGDVFPNPGASAFEVLLPAASASGGERRDDAGNPVGGWLDLQRIGDFAIVETIGGDVLLVDASDENARVARFTSQDEAKTFWRFVEKLAYAAIPLAGDGVDAKQS